MVLNSTFNFEEIKARYEEKFKKTTNRCIALFALSYAISLGNLYYQENMNQESLNNKNPHVLENLLGLSLPQSSVFAYAIISARNLRRKRDMELTINPSGI